MSESCRGGRACPRTFVTSEESQIMHRKRPLKHACRPFVMSQRAFVASPGCVVGGTAEHQSDIGVSLDGARQGGSAKT